MICWCLVTATSPRCAVYCRDLHWGNVLVKTTKQKKGSFLLNGAAHSLETKGVLVRIIDYSLSRLEIGQTCIYIYFFFIFLFFIFLPPHKYYTFLESQADEHVLFSPDDLTVSCDISKDEELFMGQGDYQFDIYRLMRQENGSVHLCVSGQTQKQPVRFPTGVCVQRRCHVEKFKSRLSKNLNPFINI